MTVTSIPIVAASLLSQRGKRIYGRKIPRTRHASRLRTISEAILALERRVPRDGPGRSSYALLQQRQTTPAFWTMDDALHPAPSSSPNTPFLNYGLGGPCALFRLSFDRDPLDRRFTGTPVSAMVRL